jgi:hypothetical protein
VKTLRLRAGCLVQVSGRPDNCTAPKVNRKGTYLGKCSHGFYLVGFSPSYDGHSGHNEVEVPDKFRGHCAWFERNELEVIE